MQAIIDAVSKEALCDELTSERYVRKANNGNNKIYIMRIRKFNESSDIEDISKKYYWDNKTEKQARQYEKLMPGLLSVYNNLLKYGHIKEIPEHGCLDYWAYQGCLMLNASLTVKLNQRATGVQSSFAPDNSWSCGTLF